MSFNKTVAGVLTCSVWVVFANPVLASDECAGALGTSRVISVDVSETFGIGSFQYPRLPLKSGEVVLTFDDGPSGRSTRKILRALRKECVKATFFMLGAHADDQPDLVRRIRYEGHTIASHSYSHPDLTKLDPADAEAEMVDGYRAVEDAAYWKSIEDDAPRFFRFPDFRTNDDLEAMARSHAMTIVSADISPKDWRGDPPDETLQRLLKILETNTSGIIVLHDTQMNTARMLPRLLDEMKARGMKVVHIVPK